VWAIPSHKLSPDPLQVAAIVGPTGVGKTALSLSVAGALHAEIVSIDSMQIYRGMDVGTAKPNVQQRDAIRHHLVDLVDPSTEVSVAEFQARARAAIYEIAERGKLPLLVGGSGLYFRAVVDDLEFPPRAPRVRAQLEAEIERSGVEELYGRLRELDPAAASRIDPSNERRIVRALEVIEVTGEPFSANVTWETYESIYKLSVVGLFLRRPALYERIEARVDRMLEGGLVDEVRELERHGLSRTAAQALGYRQIVDSPGPSVREEIVRATKRFARRQESWFRQDPRITWIDASAENLAGRVVEHFSRSLGLA
jgi:tRNA dimethylallyltransferase